MRQSNLFILLALLLSVVGCSPKHDAVRMQTLNQAQLQGFSPVLLQTNPFMLTSYQKITQPNQPLHLYIEGDGRSWISRHQISTDPTPLNPLALKLALLDTAPNVVYLARPCQYTPHKTDPACQQNVWSFDRFSPRIIHSMNEALNILKRQTHTKGFHLIGFSGGASIAALLAEQRQDVLSLRTVAGDLNHQALSHYHRTTPLANALNPMTQANKLHQLPQQHFVGANDRVVPSFIAEQFTQRVNHVGGHCAKTTVLSNVDHQKGWVERWPDLLNLPMDCR